MCVIDLWLCVFCDCGACLVCFSSMMFFFRASLLHDVSPWACVDNVIAYSDCLKRIVGHCGLVDGHLHLGFVPIVDASQGVIIGCFLGMSMHFVALS